MRARDNPFATARLQQVPFRFPAGWTMGGLLARLAAANWRGALVGPEGSGKTTLLENLAPALRSRGFEPLPLRLDAEHRNLEGALPEGIASQIGPRAVILLDGAEQLGHPSWWRFERAARRAGGLVVTSHRAGLLPTLLECRTSFALFLEIVRELVAGCALLDEAFLQALFAARAGNIRLALLDLYDHFANRETCARR